jgi:hypothetical protein
MAMTLRHFRYEGEERRLSRQIINRFDAITITAPATTVDVGHSFQIMKPNRVAQTMLE